MPAYHSQMYQIPTWEIWDYLSGCLTQEIPSARIAKVVLRVAEVFEIALAMYSFYNIMLCLYM